MSTFDLMLAALKAVDEWIKEAKYRIDCGDSERRIRLYHCAMKVEAAIAQAEADKAGLHTEETQVPTAERS